MARIDIIKTVARNLGDLIVDATPASLTGSTVDCTDLVHPNAEQIRGKYFYAYSGAGAGQSRVVSSFNTTYRRMVFQNVFTTTPSSNTNFILTDKFDKSEYDNALNQSIKLTRLKFLQEKVGTSQIIGTQYDYAVPSGMAYIYNLKLVPSLGNDYSSDEEIDTIQELPPRYWNVERNTGGSYMIVFDSRFIHLDQFDGHTVRILGQAPPDIVATDNATIPEELEAFLEANTSLLLSATKQAAGEPWKTLYSLFRDEVRPRTGEGLEAYIFRYGRGKKVG